MTKKKDFMGCYKKRYNPEKEGYGDTSQWNQAFNARMGRDEARKTLGDSDPWSVLELSKSASWEEVKKAYRKLAMQHHPDRNGGDCEMFKKIQAAYELLEEHYAG